MVSQLLLGLVVTQVFNLQYFNPQLVSCSHLVKSSIWRPMKLQALCLHPDLHVQQGMDGTLKVWKVDGRLDGDLAVILETPTNNLDPPARLRQAGVSRKWCLEPPGWILWCSAWWWIVSDFGISLSHTNLKMNTFFYPLKMPCFYPRPMVAGTTTIPEMT